jgi:hypothetical protein
MYGGRSVEKGAKKHGKRALDHRDDERDHMNLETTKSKHLLTAVRVLATGYSDGGIVQLLQTNPKSHN